MLHLASATTRPADGPIVELLNGMIFSTVAEALVLIERWREHYNRVRPHSALGYRPSAPEAIAAGPASASRQPVEQRLSMERTTA